MKTSGLSGAALDWAVAKCEYVGEPPFVVIGGEVRERTEAWKYSPSTDWAQGGPIIDREGIAIDCLRIAGDISGWVAALPSPTTWEDEEFVEEYNGPTPLIAAMRCYVSSKLGDEVDVPEELT